MADDSFEVVSPVVNRGARMDLQRFGFAPGTSLGAIAQAALDELAAPCDDLPDLPEPPPADRDRRSAPPSGGALQPDQTNDAARGALLNADH